MWNIENKKYSNRPLHISKTLYFAIKKYASRYDFSISFTIKQALSIFFLSTKMGKDGINFAEQKKILSEYRMPGNSEKKISLHVNKKDIDLIRKINRLPKINLCSSTEESMRRILTWHLKKKGFL